ncbi:MAG: ferrochelatase, partial [Chloroflexota bacterium]
MSESRTETLGVLLSAYGGPRSLAEVEPFLGRVTGGRALAPSMVTEFRRRYEVIGGSSPLPGIVESLAAKVQERLDATGRPHHVLAGMLFSRPSVADA